MSATRTAPARASGIDRYFRITERGSSISQELRGGLATFLAMSYIVVLNPLILSGADTNGCLLYTSPSPRDRG